MDDHIKFSKELRKYKNNFIKALGMLHYKAEAFTL